MDLKRWESMNTGMMRFLNITILLLLGLGIVPARSGPIFAHSRYAAWPGRYFAPYSLDRSGQFDLTALSQSTGTKFFTLAFMVTGQGRPCRASWNEKQPAGSWMRDTISKLQAAGGDVSVAFGGSAGVELALSCKTVSSLRNQYQAVIDAYHLTHLDFDIEGKTLADTGRNHLRNKAIAGLQVRAAAEGRPLSISYTLPVSVTGLTPVGLNLLRDASASGVTIGVVNLMTMDYHSRNAPGDQMGQNAIKAARSAFGQLRSLYPSRSAGQIWSMIGITPMMGVNADQQEIFTLRDAQAVLNFAEKQQIALLSFWNIQRDRSCTKGEVAPHHCSGVTQQPYQYDRAFAPFTLAGPAPAG